MKSFLQSGLAASGMVFGCQRYDGPVVPLHYARQKQALDKKRQQASKQLQAQLLHHDRTNAKRRDDCLMGNAAEALQLKSDMQKQKGSGQWLTCEPRWMLRVVFDQSSGGTLRQLAAANKSNHTHVQNTRACIAQTCISLHNKAASIEFQQERKHNWIAFHLQWDEAKFVVKLTSGPPSAYSVLGLHGQFHWETENMDVKVQEMPRPPKVVERSTADNQFGAICEAFPNLKQWLDGSLFSVMQVSKDSVAANQLVVKWLHKILPPHVLILSVDCLQHQASLTISPTTVYMGFIGGLFCTVKQLQSGNFLANLEKALYKLLDHELNVVNAADQPINSEDTARLDALLEMCYHGRSHDEHRANSDNLKQERAFIRRMYTGDIRSATVTHHCRGPGCCRSREDSVSQATQAIMQPLRRRIHPPALNRWLQVFPVVSTLFVLLSIHNLFPRAALLIIGAAARAFVDFGSELEQDVHGADTDYRRQEGRRRRKMHQFLASPNLSQRLALWLSFADPVMHIHHWLFKIGSIHGADEDGLSALQRCCQLQRSLPVQTMSQLSMCFDVTSENHYIVWRLALKVLGPMHTWSAQCLKEAAVCVNIIIGNLWRRFYARFKDWPWRLSVLTDDTADRAMKLSVVEEFMNCPLCCLDEYFSQRLRKLVNCSSDFFLPPMQRFLKAAFTCPATTTHLENAFAHMRSHVNRSWRAPHMATVAAAHSIREISRVFKIWREKKESARTAASLRRRPVWTMSKQQRNRGRKPGARSEYVKWRLTSLNVENPCPFDLDAHEHSKRLFRRAQQDWKEVRRGKGDLARWKLSADVQTQRMQSLSDPLEEFIKASEAGTETDLTSLPWGCADEEYPLSESLLSNEILCHRNARKRKSFVQLRAAEWREACGTMLPGPGVIPSKVTVQTPCLSSCGECLQTLPIAVKCVYDTLRRDLAMVVAPLRTTTLGQQMMLHFSLRNNHTEGFTVLNTTHLKTRPYATGEFQKCKLQGTILDAGRNISPPFDVQGTFVKVSSFKIRDVITETDVSIKAARLCGGNVAELCWHEFIYHPVMQRGSIDLLYRVTSVREICFQEEREYHADVVCAEAATQLFERSSPQAQGINSPAVQLCAPSMFYMSISMRSKDSISYVRYMHICEYCNCYRQRGPQHRARR